MSEIEKLLEVMARLRNRETGCPWDREQTFESIAPYTVEEAYEVADAIAREDMDALRGELGDLLFQVVFHSRMAEEMGLFDFADVAHSINEKMLRRHPHVFGNEKERARGAVPGSWERIKADEREAGTGKISALDDIALALPALKRASKLGKRAAGTGFDWPDRAGPRDKIDEELAELDAAVASGDMAAIEDELGDLLFSACNLARHLAMDPEAALAGANRKFERRFRRMESAVADAGGKLDDMSLDELENAWQSAKSKNL